MGCYRSIVAKLPQHEFDVRRQCGLDNNFRSICMDYEEAAAALRLWQSIDAGDEKAEEYEVIMGELEKEILALLEPLESMIKRA